MSKYVKHLVVKDIAQRLRGVEDALLVNVVGLDANQSVQLRRQFRQKNINMIVVKNSLARRAAVGLPLAAALEGVEGSLAIVWGGDDIISLAKEVCRLDEDSGFAAFQARGGIMDGERLSAERVKEIRRWPSRHEQLCILAGQILGPGANLVAGLVGPGARVAGQIKQRASNQEENNQEPSSENQ
jgi:ribosomal protein L10